MVINGSLDGLKKDVISNLSKDKLKQYIFHLTQKYYVSYIEGDEKTFNHSLEQLHEISNEYNLTYSNLKGYIFFCFYVNANNIISKASSNEKFSLVKAFNYDLIEDEDFEDDLRHDIKEIFNKERIKERYNEKTTD